MTQTDETIIASPPFEPKIIGILCKWCSLAAADLAGTARMKMPQTITTIRVPCSGRVDPSHVLEAFAQDADGVLVGGCHPGDCHYLQGNYNAMRRIPLLQTTLKQMGIDPARVRLEWISGGESQKFVDVVSEFTEQIRSLGPLNWSPVLEK
ncbi:MAG: hydrogenase iron-sulfur subunit [Candidatus Hodarchaeales archaeon]|jgi:F420-non-reducing hydrogenase iron-sulfur subunit